ncbi:hypothetical protein Ciccas_007916, partial [Cichlidogyrus casuarinus]
LALTNQKVVVGGNATPWFKAALSVSLMPKCGRPSFVDSQVYMKRNEAFQRFAPYGTQYTPIQRVKIVGGKYVTVRENRNDGTVTEKLRTILDTGLTHCKQTQEVETHLNIPSQQISLSLTNAEIFALLKRVRQQLCTLVGSNIHDLLKRAYILLANGDLQDTGLASFDSIESTFGILGIRIYPSDLRLLATLFLEKGTEQVTQYEHRPRRVSYEKMLTVLEDLLVNQEVAARKGKFELKVEKPVPHFHVEKSGEYDKQLGIVGNPDEKEAIRLVKTSAPNRVKLPPLKTEMKPTKSKLIGKNWFDRFLDMANELYRLDPTHRGQLESALAMRSLESLNQKLDLGFERQSMESATTMAIIPDTGGKADIDVMLRALARRS